MGSPRGVVIGLDGQLPASVDGAELPWLVAALVCLFVAAFAELSRRRLRRRRRCCPPSSSGRSADGVPAGDARVAGRLRILIITSEAPPIVSGISRSVDRLTTGLRARGHEVDVLSSVQIPRLVLGEVRLSALTAYWPVLARRLRQYDVVNLHGPVPTVSDAFLILCRLLPKRPCPILYTHHSAVQIKGAERLCGLYNRIHDALSSDVALTMTTSQYYADLLGAPTGRPVRVVPWGVDIRPKRLRPRGGLRPLRVLFVGQMRPYKGVELLLTAVADCNDIELVLVGGGDKLCDYRLLAADLGGANVQFLGRVSDEDLLVQYDHSDVVALPSVTRAEAFGLVVLEGMAAGCVPVVSDLPGVRDLVSRTGVVVPPRNGQRLRAALLGLAADRARLEQLSRAARRRAEGLGWDTCVARYEEAFFAALGVDPARSTPTTRSNGHAAGSDRRSWRVPATRSRTEPERELVHFAPSGNGVPRPQTFPSMIGRGRSGNGRG